MRISKDLLAGLLFVFLGGTALLISSGYRIGTVLKMGPGYFPVLISSVVLVLGLIIAGRAAFTGTTEPLERIIPNFRPILSVLAAVVAFALLLPKLGLVLSIVALIVISRMARPEGGWGEFVLMVCVLTAIGVGVFAYGLKLPLELWPSL